MPLWSHCYAKMYWGGTGHDDFTDLAEANTFYNLFESHFKVLQPASTGQEDLRLKT